MTDCVTLQVNAHVAHVKLNRPAKHNAVNLAMFEELANCGDRIQNDVSVRAVVVSGAGDHFCAGIDTDLFSNEIPDLASKMAPQASSPANFFQRAAYVWKELSVPVICAMHGVVYGAGLQIALGADLRFAAHATKLSVMEIRWGLIPDMAISTVTRGLVRIDKLQELAFTGRVIGADEALQAGLVTGLSEDPLGHAMSVATDIATKSPNAIKALKQLLNHGLHLPAVDALRLEARLQSALMGQAEQAEAVRANLEKRPARFET